jgi:hypothetical protein
MRIKLDYSRKLDAPTKIELLMGWFSKGKNRNIQTMRTNFWLQICNNYYLTKNKK